MGRTLLTDGQSASVARIHSTYCHVLLPLLKPLKQIYGLQLNPVYNEIRAIFTHIARVYSPRIKSRSREIEKASGHLNRVLLDTFKLYALHFYDELAYFERRHKRISLSKVDGGQFYTQYFQFKSQAEMNLKEAKRLEDTDKKLAFQHYEKAYVQNCGLISYIKKHDKELNACRLHHYVRLALNAVLMLLGSAITAIISSFGTEKVCDFLMQVVQ